MGQLGGGRSCCAKSVRSRGAVNEPPASSGPWRQPWGIPAVERAKLTGGLFSTMDVQAVVDRSTPRPGMRSGPFLPLGGDLLYDVELRVDTCAGVDQKRVLLLKRGRLSLRSERHRRSDVPVPIHVDLKGVARLDATLIPHLFWNGDAAVVVNRDLQDGRRMSGSTTAFGKTTFCPVAIWFNIKRLGVRTFGPGRIFGAQASTGV